MLFGSRRARFLGLVSIRTIVGILLLLRYNPFAVRFKLKDSCTIVPAGCPVKMIKGWFHVQTEQ